MEENEKESKEAKRDNDFGGAVSQKRLDKKARKQEERNKRRLEKKQQKSIEENGGEDWRDLVSAFLD